MSPSQRREGPARPWRVLAAALLLLGSLGLERGIADAGMAVRGYWVPPVEGRTQLHEDVVHLLLDVNRRLGRPKAERVANSVLRCSDDHGLRPENVLAVMIVESGARPSARSPKGAIGLMQVMPYMFSSTGVAGNITHIESNVEAGCRLLADNIRRLGEDRGISTYFWGSWIRGEGYLRKVKAVRDTLDIRSSPDVATGSRG